jgi:hypothetical protein
MCHNIKFYAKVILNIQMLKPTAKTIVRFSMLFLYYCKNEYEKHNNYDTVTVRVKCCFGAKHEAAGDTNQFTTGPFVLQFKRLRKSSTALTRGVQTGTQQLLFQVVPYLDD